MIFTKHQQFTGLLVLLYSVSSLAAEKVSLSGTVEAVACAAACGICCPTHRVIDTSATLILQIGNAFVDLSKISDDGQVHQLSGYFYETTGQCGIGECTLFAVEQIDQQQIAEPAYDLATEELSIQSIVIDDVDGARYAVTLSAPFNVVSSVELTEQNTVAQGGDCAGENAICTDDTVCVAYFGIAGSQGPEFHSCEIPCSHPGASCPLGQSCVTIADGPGQVCAID
ncbi:MAG: hypothetical protein IIC60_03745 [Proteobacteria bacterium]|nr:hypothetical protein [Pseudomonadota bacterium]